MTAISSERAVIANASIDLLCFDIGCERFAMPLTDVEEVVDGLDVGRAGDEMKSLSAFRLRDDIIPVCSAGVSLSVTCFSAAPYALVLTNLSRRIALLVDEAEAKLAVDMTELRDLPAYAERDGVFVGAIRIDGRWASLLDADALIESLLPADVSLSVTGYGNGS